MHRLQGLLGFCTRNAAFINVAVAIALTVSKAYTISLPTWFFVCLSVSSTLAALVDRYARQLQEKESAAIAIRTVMSSFLREIGSERIARLRLRLNLLLPDSQGRLCSRYNVNMSGDPDLDLVWNVNQGYVGLCFAKAGAVVEDLSPFRGLAYEDLLALKADSSVRWGLTRDHWIRLNGVGSALCVPVPHPTKPNQPIGVLVLDSKEPLSVTHFDSEEVLQTWAHRHAPCLSELLCQAELAAR